MNAWQTAPLGALCDVAAGGTPSRTNSAYFGGGVPWVKIGDMLQGEVTSTEETISQVGLSNSSAKLLPSGTVIISIFATIGRTAVLRLAAATNQAIAGLTPRDPNKLIPEYLRLFLDAAVKELERRARGVAQANINLGILKALQVPLPPVDDQRRIATLLDKAESLRATRFEALAQLDELSHAIFLDMFGEVHSCGWTTTTVAGVAHADRGSIRTGPFGSQLLHSEFVDGGVAVLGIDNVVANEFRWAERRFITEAKYRDLKRYTVQPGDVLVSIMGTCGRCAVVPKDISLAINTKHLCCITLDRKKCLPTFLHAYFLRHPLARRYLNRAAKGAIMSGLNMGVIKSMPVSLPPLALQQEFAGLVEAIGTLRTSQEVHLAELEALFASLQYRAFRGEL